jgi:dynein heavy chain, axonemal
LLISDSKLSVGSFILDDLNNLLNQDRVLNLYPSDEWTAIEEKLRQTAKRQGLTELSEHGTREDLREYFNERNGRHLHVVVTMSPVGKALRERIRDFPALVTCCSINWLERWPLQALQFVSKKLMKKKKK